MHMLTVVSGKSVVLPSVGQGHIKELLKKMNLKSRRAKAKILSS